MSGLSKFIENIYKKQIKDPSKSSTIILQWHITDQCNYRCKHCYQEETHLREMTLKQKNEVINQFKKLLRYLNKIKNYPVYGQITITGGEPLLSKDFWTLLDVVKDNKDLLSFAILTNGTLVDRSVAERIKKYNPKYVQVSLEGTEQINDNIRGVGNFNKTIEGIKNLVNQEIRTSISFTANKENFSEFSSLALIASDLGVNRIWSDRIIPCGRGAAYKNNLFSPQETKDFFDIMYKAKLDLDNLPDNKTTVAMDRALQFLVSGGRPYRCTAGDTLITIMSNGDIYPCRRMPVKVGNVTNTPLHKMYFHNDLFRKLRDKNLISEKCQKCAYSNSCRGGLKCLTYAICGNPFDIDPGCWLSQSP